MLQAARQTRGRRHCSDLQPSGGECSLRGKTKSKQLRDGPGALVSVPNTPLVSGGASWLQVSDTSHACWCLSKAVPCASIFNLLLFLQGPLKGA